jgi:uncharacterized protein (TIGR03435 family)
MRTTPAMLALLTVSGLGGQTQSPAGMPKFEVASVKPCQDDAGPGYRGGRGISSPGRFDLVCQPLRVFIVRAYVYYRDGRFNMLQPLPEIQGAPDWIDDRYSITAKAEGAASEGMMDGPMLQALLEDRFKLKIHRATKEVPVYELTVAKGGLKAPRFTGNCTPWDWNRPLRDQMQDPKQEHCVDRTTGKGARVMVQLDAMSVDAFIKFFPSQLDRPIIDKTGLGGLFDFHLEFAPETASADGGAADPAGPSIFAVLQEQLGLRLTPAKGPGEFLVIDHVERPSEN